MPAFERNNSNGKIDRLGDDYIEYAKKSKKSKVQKLLKSQNLSKLGKKSSKSENSLNLGAKKTGPSFLIFGVRETFNYLQLIFIKAPIF